MSKLIDYCFEITEGYTNPSKSKKDLFIGDLKWVRAVDLNDSIIMNTSQNLSRSVLNCVTGARLFPKGSIVVSKSGTIGKLGVLSEDMVANRACIVITPNPLKINPSYLFYLLLFNREKLINTSIGSVQKNLYASTLRDMVFDIPTLEEQEKIANLLSALDNKININNQINKDLEEIAQTLYTKWFVNFDFPNEEGNPYKSSGGEMNDSELGKIPVGWSVCKLGDVCKTLLGGTPSRKKEEYWNGDINWINSGALNEFRVSTPTEKITDLGLNKSATKLLPKGTTCIGITGNILISLLAIDSCANQSVVGVLENEVLPKEYLFYNIKNRENYYKSLMSGAVQQHINKDIVDETLILIPNKVILNQYKEKVSSIFNQIEVNLFENQQLKETRDLLLPYIMSGKVVIS